MRFRILRFLLALFCAASPARAQKAEQLWLPPGTTATIDRIYGGDPDGAIKDAQRVQEGYPDQPLGYLLEAEARWWKIWCASAEYKYGMTMARHRPVLEVDRQYLDLAAKISALAETKIKTGETAELRFYDGMGYAMAARLYRLRWESRNTARAGVRARENFARALALEPGFSDAYLGLGLYNYYVDTLSGMTRVLRFLMGIPGGSKQEGIRQLRSAIRDGVLTPAPAAFYLGIDLHNYDQRYEESLGILGSLSEKYPGNPLFQLAVGDLYAKLGHKEQAEARYRAAATIPIVDAECVAHIQKLARISLSSLHVDGRP